MKHFVISLYRNWNRHGIHAHEQGLTEGGIRAIRPDPEENRGPP